MNQPILKFWLKSQSNHHLIDFLVPNLSSESKTSWRNQLKQIQFQSKTLKSIENGSKYIQNDKIDQKVDGFWLFWSLNWHCNQKSNEFNQNMDLNSVDLIKNESKSTKIEIVGPILTLKFKFLWNRCPNSLESDFESLMIRFGSPNRLT